VIERLKDHFGMFLWIVLLVLLLLVLLLIVRLRGKGALLAVLLVAVVLGVLILLARARTTKPKTTYVANVVSGKEYSWKVIAETRDGVFVESATYRFETVP
jgi:hypothetical protein